MAGAALSGFGWVTLDGDICTVLSLLGEQRGRALGRAQRGKLSCRAAVLAEMQTGRGMVRCGLAACSREDAVRC